MTTLVPEIRRMAETLAADDLARLPVDERVQADLLADRIRRGLSISDDDIRRLRDAYARRHREIAALSVDYAWPC